MRLRRLRAVVNLPSLICVYLNCKRLLFNLDLDFFDSFDNRFL